MPAQGVPSPAGDRATTVAITVITYRRPELLAALLASLQAQEFDDSWAVRLIVVDNDAERSAERVVRDSSGPLPGALRG